MSASSTRPDAGASNQLQAGLQLVSTRLASTSLEALGEAISRDATQACKVRAGDLGAKVHEVVRMLYAAGLKVVPSDRVCVQRETYQAISTIAAKAMADQEVARRLMWEDE